jgi:hypothetical protein
MTLSAPFRPNQHPWIVEFNEPRCENQQQADALQKIGVGCLHRLIRAFIAAVLPDAEVLDAEDRLVRTVLCVRRSDARKFVATWGGRIVTGMQSTR